MTIEEENRDYIWRVLKVLKPCGDALKEHGWEVDYYVDNNVSINAKGDKKLTVSLRILLPPLQDLKPEIGEAEYVALPLHLAKRYDPIHEDESPTLERCFRLRDSADQS